MRNPPFYNIRDANLVSQHPDGWRSLGSPGEPRQQTVEFSCECLSYHEPSRSMTQPTTTFRVSSILSRLLSGVEICRALYGSC